MNMTKLLNFGCGGTFHPAWTNVDGNPADPRILRHDLRKGLPFPAASFDGAYGSHVLEHLEPEAGARLLKECHRVLRPGGILRLAVPDLEAIARLYLEALEGAARGDAAARMHYDWMVLELLDQSVRPRSGGAMLARIQAPRDAAERAFIASRIGDEAAPRPPGKRQRTVSGALRRLRQLAAGACTWVFLGPEGRAALREGLFRSSGEVHLWMYDRYSITRALDHAGFSGARICAPDESAIAGFAGFGLETAGGRPRKPDSLFVETCKP